MFPKGDCQTVPRIQRECLRLGPAVRYLSKNLTMRKQKWFKIIFVCSFLLQLLLRPNWMKTQWQASYVISLSVSFSLKNLKKQTQPSCRCFCSYWNRLRKYKRIYFCLLTDPIPPKCSAMIRSAQKALRLRPSWTGRRHLQTGVHRLQAAAAVEGYIYIFKFWNCKAKHIRKYQERSIGDKVYNCLQ